MFTRSSAVYDAIHAQRFSASNAAGSIRTQIQATKQSEGKKLLDVACGTGAYLEHLRDQYEVEGLDLDPGMLAVARQRLPDVPLHEADLADFDLGRQFDVVLCLGSSVGYVATIPRLQYALATFARHTVPGGVVIVEPWFTPEAWETGRLSADFVDQPDLKIARILVSGREGAISMLDIHYLVGRPNGVETFVEHHRLGLFTHDEYLSAFHAAGFAVIHDPGGPLGRGLYIGTTTSEPTDE
jgi:ubiquinone/menaquinone biosynthesis C-methylase UbiE